MYPRKLSKYLLKIIKDLVVHCRRFGILRHLFDGLIFLFVSVVAVGSHLAEVEPPFTACEQCLAECIDEFVTDSSVYI